MSLAFDPDLPSGSFGRNAMLVNRSTDGGRSWSDPITLIQDPDGQVLNDKNSITADPTNANFVYAVWDRLRDFTLPRRRARRVRAAGGAARADGVVAARQRLQQLRRLAASAVARAAPAAPVFFEGPVYLARTTNGGLSWEPARRSLRPRPERADHQQPGRGPAERHGDRLLHRDLAERRHPDRPDPLLRQGSHVERADATRRRSRPCSAS